MTRHGMLALIGGLGLWASFGCAATPYRFGHFRRSQQERDAQEVVIERGQPHKTLDRIAWVIGAPARILPLSKRINKHNISPETEEKLKAYLERNDLTDVYVYVNHYDPSGQWQRLHDNKLVSPVWRYSFGAFSMVGYTLFPNRLFGGDKYNPYTNSLYLNSDVPAVVLHEAAYAKDVHSRKLPGTYVAINDLPVLSMWHEIHAVNDVLGYARIEDDWEIEKQTYRVLYPKMGAEGLGTAGPLITLTAAGSVVPMLVGPALHLGGAAAGHVAGRTLTARRDAEVHKENAIVDPATEGVQQAAYVNIEPPGDQSPITVLQRPPKP